MFGLPITYTGVRDAIIIGGLALLVWLVFRAGSDHVRASDLTALSKQIDHQMEIQRGWTQQSQAASSQMADDISRINAAAAAPAQPVWLCDKPSPKQAVLPAAAPKASGSDPARGPDDSGVRVDIAPQVKEFERRWELVLTQCRAEDAQWPR